MPHPHHEADVWSVEGRFQHLIYSPKGAVEGVLIETDGVSTQFVTDPHDLSVAEQFATLRVGQTLVIEGSDHGPSPKGESAHWVYAFKRLASIDGKPPKVLAASEEASGTVIRYNYTKHGAANGVVLDNGDFIHTKPEGLARLGLKIGDPVKAEGAARPLVTGNGRVIEARRVNGKSVEAAH